MTQYVSSGSIPRAVIAPFKFDDYVEYQIGKEKRPMRDAVMSPDGYWIAFEGWEIGRQAQYLHYLDHRHQYHPDHPVTRHRLSTRSGNRPAESPSF